MFASLGRDVERMLKEAVELAYFARGSVDYEYIKTQMIPFERQLLGDFITSRITEEVKKSNPVY